MCRHLAKKGVMMFQQEWVQSRYVDDLARIRDERLGAYITLEGPDGGGKTTHARMLVEKLTGEGYSVVSLREPGGTTLGDHIRKILLDSAVMINHDIAQLLLFVSQRAEITHNVIIPALVAGRIVIGDRGLDSSVAYQGYASGIHVDVVRMVNAIAMSGLEPHLTLVIDRAPETGLAAAEAKKEFKAGDRYERRGIEFQQRVRRGFEEILADNPERCKRIPFLDSQFEEMQQQIREYVDPLLAQRQLVRSDVRKV